MGETERLLSVRGYEQEALFESARAARAAVWGRTVILRGVIEVTNLCRVDCTFCPMRRTNSRRNDGFMLTSDEIVARAREIRRAGLDIVFLQGGESRRAQEVVTAAIPYIIDVFDGEVEILLNLGDADDAQLDAFRTAGAASYIAKHETSDPALNLSVRGQRLERRVSLIRRLQARGFKTGTGTIVGLPGQTRASLVDDVNLARRLGVDMCSVSPLVPAPDTPLASSQPGDVDESLNLLAVMRLAEPGWLIPSVSALEALGERGQKRGLLAGANVMTVNFSHSDRVGQYLIYGRDRFVVSAEHARSTVAEAGLEPRGSVFL